MANWRSPQREGRQVKPYSTRLNAIGAERAAFPLPRSSAARTRQGPALLSLGCSEKTVDGSPTPTVSNAAHSELSTALSFMNSNFSATLRLRFLKFFSHA